MSFPCSSLPGGYVEKKRAFQAQKVLKSALFRHLCHLARGPQIVASPDSLPAIVGRILSPRRHAPDVARQTPWATRSWDQAMAGWLSRPDLRPEGIGPPNPDAPCIRHASPTAPGEDVAGLRKGEICRVGESCHGIEKPGQVLYNVV